ncbi:uncharacterized protein LOC144914860 isoform X2 [Branchiostoma floridae x Branchiostoma belcheri]
MVRRRGSGWDTIFAEPIRWSRNETVKECWDHIKYTLMAAVCIMVFLWYTQGHRYLYNYQYGPFVLSEQEILDTRPENLWKQYIQVHHGKALPLQTGDVGCGRTSGSKCKRMTLQFNTRATHNRKISQLVVKRPLPHVYQSYVRHPINFSAMSVKKLMGIIRKIGKEKRVIPGMEKTELASIISKAYDLNPKEFNQATASEVSVGFLRDLNALTLIPKPEYMDLLLDTSVPYVTMISTPHFCVLLLVYFVAKIVYYNFKIAHTWASSSRILTSFASTEFQKQILESLRHISGSGYQSAALKLQKEIRSDKASTIVDEEYFRLFVTSRHVIYARNDVVEVISVDTIEEIKTSLHACDVVLSSGERLTLWMSSDQVGRMKNARALSARLRQTEERRARQQREEERRRQLQEEEARRRRLQEEEARRRQLQREEERRRQLQREEERRRQEEEARRRQRQAEQARQLQQPYAEAAYGRHAPEGEVWLHGGAMAASTTATGFYRVHNPVGEWTSPVQLQHPVYSWESLLMEETINEQVAILAAAANERHATEGEVWLHGGAMAASTTATGFYRVHNSAEEWTSPVQLQSAIRRRQQEQTLTRRNNTTLPAADRDERSVTEDAMKKIRESTCELKEDSKEKCAICLEDMKTGERVTTFSCPGKHQFHEKGLLKWLEQQSSCPVCRHQVGHRSRRDNVTRAFQLVFM